MSLSTVRQRILSDSNTNTGSIQDEMKSYSMTPVPNDGINVYGNVRINPETSGPYSDSQEITVSLCSPNFDVTEFDNSYLHLRLRLRMRFQNAPVVNGTDDFAKALRENQFVFVGLKCGNQILRNYSFKFNNVPVSSTVQSNAVYESFLYSTYMSKGERENKKYVFSPYEEVSTLDNSLCGMYVPLKDLVDGTYFYMDLILPYQMILAMSGWKEFPNRIFGDLKFVFNITSEAFVYAEVNPITSIRKAIISGKVSKTTDHITEILALDADTFEYQHAFEQVGVASGVQYITGYDSTNNRLTYGTMASFAPYIDEITTMEVWADSRGYRMKSEAIQNLKEHFSQNPFTVAAQKVEIFQFPQGAESTGLRASMNVNFNHTTDVYLLFPRDSRHRTIFTNICYDNLQLQIGSQRLPEQLVSTVSPQFHEIQIQNSDFDSIFPASEEWEHSLTDTRTDGTTILRPITDDSSFVVAYSLERDSGGGLNESLWFDGKNAITEKVELTGRPLYSNIDVYYSQTAPPPPPLMATCCDSYWIMRLIRAPSGRFVPNVQFVCRHTYEEAYQDPSIEAA